jgi:hypothetical protein
MVCQRPGNLDRARWLADHPDTVITHDDSPRKDVMRFLAILTIVGISEIVTGLFRMAGWPSAFTPSQQILTGLVTLAIAGGVYGIRALTQDI